MRLNNIGYRLLAIMAIAGGASLLSGCSFVWENQPDCPAQLSIRFVYDYNMKFADAFTREVKSLNVWAFDEFGSPVWSESVSGDVLSTGHFIIHTPLGGGIYDIVSWCGLKNNDGFDLMTYVPSSKEDLEVKLRTAEDDGQVVCRRHLPALFHGMERVEFEVNPYAPTYKTVEISLTKDTKDIRVLLQHLDGSAIDDRDFTATITCADAWLAWDNDLIPTGPVVNYGAWDTRYGQVTTPGDEDNRSRTITTVASLLFDMSTSRLMADQEVTLTIRRNTDGEDIIRIPLVEYLLLVKGHYGDMGDQEYLDRQDDYSIVFFIDDSGNWYTAGGIYINSWAVVPPQHEGV